MADKLTDLRGLDRGPAPCPRCGQTIKMDEWAHMDRGRYYHPSCYKETPMSESTNPKDKIGRTKPPLHLIPGSATVEEAIVMGLGAAKYGPYNWRDHSVAASVYVGALKRHVETWFDGEDIDPESGVSHLAHARACLGILIDAKVNGMLVDDRPKPGCTSELLSKHTQAQSQSGIDPTVPIRWTHHGSVAVDSGDTTPYTAESRDKARTVGRILDPDEKADTIKRLIAKGCRKSVAEAIAAGIVVPVPSELPTGAVLPSVYMTDYPTVYIAGPMRGYDKFNFPAFDRTRNAFLGKGYAVISPADIDRASDLNEDDDDQKFGPPEIREFVYRDTQALLALRSENGDGIVMLPGWEKSTGATAEFHLARWLGLRIFSGRTERLLHRHAVKHETVAERNSEYLKEQESD